MVTRSAEIVHDLLSDFLEIALKDSGSKIVRVLVLRFPIDPRSGVLDMNCFTCYKASELAFQFVSRELFWLYHFVLEHCDWKERLDEYDDFCSQRL